MTIILNNPKDKVECYRDFVQSHREHFNYEALQKVVFGGKFFPAGLGHKFKLCIANWNVTYIVRENRQRQWLHHLWVRPTRPKQRFSWRAMEIICHSLTDNCRPVQAACRHIRVQQGARDVWHVLVPWFDASLN